MKTALDPRHKKRQKVVEDLFKVEFLDQPIGERAREVMDNQKLIDKKITKAAPEFPIDKINKTDLAILRLATYELLVSTPKNSILSLLGIFSFTSFRYER